MEEVERALTAHERGLIEELLSFTDDHRAVQRLLDAIAVVNDERGLPILDLRVEEGVPSPIPPDAKVVEGVSRSGSDEWSHLLLLVDGGLPHGLELAWISDDPPTGFPPADDVQTRGPRSA